MERVVSVSATSLSVQQNPGGRVASFDLQIDIRCKPMRHQVERVQGPNRLGLTNGHRVHGSGMAHDGSA